MIVSTYQHGAAKTIVRRIYCGKMPINMQRIARIEWLPAKLVKLASNSRISRYFLVAYVFNED